MAGSVFPRDIGVLGPTGVMVGVLLLGAEVEGGGGDWGESSVVTVVQIFDVGEAEDGGKVGVASLGTSG